MPAFGSGDTMMDDTFRIRQTSEDDIRSIVEKSGAVWPIQMPIDEKTVGEAPYASAANGRSDGPHRSKH